MNQFRFIINVGVEGLGFEILVTQPFEFEPARGSGTLLLQNLTEKGGFHHIFHCIFGEYPSMLKDHYTEKGGWFHRFHCIFGEYHSMVKDHYTEKGG